MLFLSNVATLFLTIANLVNLKNIVAGNPKTITFWLWTEGVSAGCQDALFGVAHWFFAFEYYRIASTLARAKLKQTKAVN
jgi:hypothetical protein